MNSRFANIKRLAGLAAMATLVTTAGWSLGSGTAQADVHHTLDPDHHVFPHLFVPDHHVSKGIFREGSDREGSPVDRFFDHFFDDDHLMVRR